MVVVSEAVELDDQASVGPEGVDFRAEEGDVGRGKREPVLAAELGEAAFEWGASGGCPLRVIQEVLDFAEAAPAVASLADLLEFRQAEQAEAVGLFEGPLELALVDEVGEVEEGARDGGDWDDGVGSAVVGIESATMQADAFPSGSSVWRCHVDGLGGGA